MNNMKSNFWLRAGILLFVSQTVQALDIHTWDSSNGVKVLFVETHDLPMIDVRLVFKAGSSRDGDQYGISSLVNALLVEGTGERSAEQIAAEFESVGAELGHDSLRDMAWISLRSLSEQPLWDSVVDPFARLAAQPSFPQDAIDRDRQAMLINLSNRKKEISDITEDAFYRLVYQQHPYEVGKEGRQGTLKALTREDLVKFHERYYVARNATLSLVGDLSLSQAKQYAEQLTKYLQPGQPAQPIKPAQIAQQGITEQVFFKTTQTHVMQGLPVLSRNDPDYYALYLGNHILGGSGFSSRLMQEIRENRGLVYSVYSYFIPMESSGPFLMALQTSNSQVDEAAGLLEQMLIDFISTGPTDKEIEHAKMNITGGFPLKIDSNRKIVDYLSLIGFYELPLDYLDRFNENILAVSIADIKDAFARRVKPGQMMRVIVGEPS